MYLGEKKKTRKSKRSKTDHRNSNRTNGGPSQWDSLAVTFNYRDWHPMWSELQTPWHLNDFFIFVLINHGQKKILINHFAFLVPFSLRLSWLLWITEYSILLFHVTYFRPTKEYLLLFFYRLFKHLWNVKISFLIILKKILIYASSSNLMKQITS